MLRMSNLLEFQHTMAEKGSAIYSIETAELNPTKFDLDELKDTKEEYNLDSYGLSTLRKYIINKSEILTETGNVIKGVIKGKQVVLTVLKVK